MLLTEARSLGRNWRLIPEGQGGHGLPEGHPNHNWCVEERYPKGEVKGFFSLTNVAENPHMFPKRVVVAVQEKLASL